MTPQKFVEKYKSFALKTQQKTGISAIFILAQAALESGWGKSAPGNMLFGVKASKTTPANKKQLLVTREILSHPNGIFPEILSKKQRLDGRWEYRVRDWFRKYDTPEECFTDHANFFFRYTRYAKALEVKHDPDAFAQAVADAGYATDPNYARSLKSIIRIIRENMQP